MGKKKKRMRGKEKKQGGHHSLHTKRKEVIRDPEKYCIRVKWGQCQRSCLCQAPHQIIIITACQAALEKKRKKKLSLAKAEIVDICNAKPLRVDLFLFLTLLLLSWQHIHRNYVWQHCSASSESELALVSERKSIRRVFFLFVLT